jgi:two-component system cell cycle sensor histidine kinase/response regulator CckA
MPEGVGDMLNKKGNRTSVTALRDRAEILLSLSPRDIDAEEYKSIQTLIHELSVYQVELEMQNENLRNAQLELQAQRDKYLELYNTIPVAYLTVSDEGLVLEANNTTLEMFGTRKRDLIDSPITRLVAPESQDKFYLLSKQVFKTGEKQSCEIILKKANGQMFSAYLESVSVGEPVNITGSQRIAITDITERTKLEEERQKTKRLESISALAGGIAHDFNNLLTGIMGNISLAKRYIKPDEDAYKRLDEAERASLRAKDLTQQLLTFASGGMPVKKVVPLGKIVEDAATFTLRGSNVRCEFLISDDILPAAVDEGQIGQVINNLVLNACQAMPEGGIINIRVNNTTIRKGDTLPLPHGIYIQITVEDHGMGIPKEHLPRIFDPYFTTKQKGSGLGLATTHSIIKNHGGYTIVDSAVGVGTTVNIYLPASRAQVLKKEPKEVQPSFIGQGRILVMDDEEPIRNLLHRVLTRAGYEVELTADGAEAVEKYREAREAGRPFDAAILDLTVPGGMGGSKAIQEMLEIEPTVKAIVSSGYATDPIMAEYKKYGFSGVVAKPYSVAAIEKTIHGLLRKK